MRGWSYQTVLAVLAGAVALLPPIYAQDAPQSAFQEPQGTVVCATSIASESAKNTKAFEISVAELTFEGDLHLPISDQEQVASSLKQRAYQGDTNGVTAELEERVRRAWEDRGYFKVRVRGSSSSLTSSPIGERIRFTAHIIEGPQYSLGRISFDHNRAVSNAQALRDLFPIKDGDIFSREKISEGLENLRSAYGQMGYINFTPVPNANVEAEQDVVNLRIDVDEGKQFFISSIDAPGIEQSARLALLQDLPQKPGDIFNSRLVDLFWKNHPSLLPVDATPASRTSLRLDEKNATVAITLNLQRCPLE